MQINKTILVVEDDPQVRQLLCSFLRRLGYEARTASDGARALGLVRTAAPDLVLLDVDLPDGSGFDRCRAIKSSPDLASTLTKPSCIPWCASIFRREFGSLGEEEIRKLAFLERTVAWAVYFDSRPKRADLAEDRH